MQECNTYIISCFINHINLDLVDHEKENNSVPDTTTFQHISEMIPKNYNNASSEVKRVLSLPTESQFEKIMKGKIRVSSEDLVKTYFWTSLLDEVSRLSGGISFSRMLSTYHLMNKIKKEKTRG